MRNAYAGAQKYTFQIDGHYLSPFFDCGIFDGKQKANAGIVDQYIQLAMATEDHRKTASDEPLRPWIEDDNFNPGCLMRDMDKLPKRLGDRPEWRHIQDYWREAEEIPAVNLDGSQYELVDNPKDDGTISDFSQELRLSNASAPGDFYTLNAANLPGEAFRNNLSEDNVSWRVGVDFKARSSTLLYANISRGYKAGSFPVITASLQSHLVPAKQESITSYEAGFKTKLADNKIQLSGAVFYQDYRDKQIQGTVATGLFGLLQRLDNLPKSHIFGVEAAMVARPVEGLTRTGSASYLKTKVDRYAGTSVFGADVDFAGDP